MIKKVLQEDKFGCGIACMAMVLDKEYSEVLKDFKTDFSSDGITTEQLMNYLGDKGFSVLLKQITHYNDIDFARTEMLKPFADFHIISVHPYFDAEMYHFVVMDNKGKIYCPSGSSEHDVKSSYAIPCTVGLYKKS